MEQTPNNEGWRKRLKAWLDANTAHELHAERNRILSNLMIHGTAFTIEDLILKTRGTKKI